MNSAPPSPLLTRSKTVIEELLNEESLLIFHIQLPSHTMGLSGKGSNQHSSGWGRSDTWLKRGQDTGDVNACEELTCSPAPYRVCANVADCLALG